MYPTILNAMYMLMEKQQAADEIKLKRTNYSINDIQNIILLISTTFLYYQSNIDQ